MPTDGIDLDFQFRFEFSNSCEETVFAFLDPLVNTDDYLKGTSRMTINLIMV